MKKDACINIPIALSIMFCSILAAQEMPKENKVAYLEQLKKIEAGIEAGPFQADWQDLEKHETAPEWFSVAAQPGR